LTGGEQLTAPSPFRQFLWSRFTGQVAQNALLYAVLIAVVERSDSSLASTLLVVAFLVPSIVLGVPGGLLADVLPKRATLTGVLLARAAVAVALLWRGDDLATIYLLVLALATVGQVSGPAEAALVPVLVPPERLARGNAALNFTLVAAQVLGAVALAPLLLWLIGAGAVFALAAALFAVAAWQMLRVRPGAVPAEGATASGGEGFRRALTLGWRIIMEDRSVFRAVVRLTLVGTVLKIVVAVSPVLARDVLHIAASNTVFVMAPAAVGGALGLLVAAPLARVAGRAALSAIGFVLFALGTAALSATTAIGDWLSARPGLSFDRIQEITSVPGAVTVAMLLALLLGLAFALTTVAVRTLINERAPRGAQGRVFATQLTLADAASLLPLVAAGALADWIGVNLVLLASGVLCFAAEVAARRHRTGAPATGGLAIAR
jgi:MFS family permease